MPEEQTNGESGLKSQIAKYIRWFLISVNMIAILYADIMENIFMSRTNCFGISPPQAGDGLFTSLSFLIMFKPLHSFLRQRMCRQVTCPFPC